MVQGMCQTDNRGLPKCVVNLVKTQDLDAAKVHGTIQAAVLKDNPLCEILVAASVYDTKPVNFLSMMCDDIKRLQKTRKIYNKVAKKMVPVTFHCLNINQNYNYHMKETDVADQLCGYYSTYRFSRNYKWWHSIFWWGIEVCLVNSYKVYCSYLQMNGLQPVSHYDFHKSVSDDCVDPDSVSRYKDEILTSVSAASSFMGSEQLSSASRRSRVLDVSLHP